MLLQQKLETMEQFSSNEKIVAQYLLKQIDDIKNISINQISKITYTSPSTTVRLAQKLGYGGWKELKLAIIEEKRYLCSRFQDIDVNQPFDQHDSLQDLSYKLALLLSQAIYDTVSLIEHDELMGAVKVLDQAKRIYIFAITNSASVAYDFQRKMKYIDKQVVIVDNPEDFYFTLRMMNHDDCCILISYSGETFEIVKDAYDLFHHLKCPSISMTSIGGNSLMTYTQYHLYISTREKLSSKIAPYVSNESIHYLLDLLYSGLFQKHYNDNWDKIHDITSHIDQERYSNVSILKEE